VFHSQSSDPIGPIRSGRTQDIDLFTSFNSPLFVWSGGNAGVTRLINDSFLINMGPNNAGGYYRGPGRAPHNLYTSTDNIWFQTPPDHPGPPPQQFEYLDEDEGVEGEPTRASRSASAARTSPGPGTPTRMRFDRSQRGRPHDDSLFGRIRSTNVVVMGVEYRPSASTAQPRGADHRGGLRVGVHRRPTARRHSGSVS
jgi:hypothetical protein